MTIEDFLVNTPPNKAEDVVCKTTTTEHQYTTTYTLELSPAKHYCTICEGVRTFNPDNHRGFYLERTQLRFIIYKCRDCTKFEKIYPVYLTLTAEKSANICKIGEQPAFGPPTPPKLISLIGPDKSIFLTGRRAENQGMGIGAYTYYRRVVENQKNRIISELIKAMKKISVDKTIINKFEDAKNEKQFSKAMGIVKDVFPKALLIEGHNPMTLLHDALSNGLHAKTDEECLELATSIRVVLGELASRIHELSKEDNEIKKAISSLFKK